MAHSLTARRSTLVWTVLAAHFVHIDEFATRHAVDHVAANVCTCAAHRGNKASIDKIDLYFISPIGPIFGNFVLETASAVRVTPIFHYSHSPHLGYRQRRYFFDDC